MKTQVLRAFLWSGLIGVLLTFACADTTQVSGPNSVRLDEWSIRLGSAEQPAGTLTLQIQNTGTMTHEVYAIRTDLTPDKLPVSSGTVDLRQLDVIGKKEDIERREKASLDLSLTPGAYVFICNISGHYAQGMHAALQVR